LFHGRSVPEVPFFCGSEALGELVSQLLKNVSCFSASPQLPGPGDLFPAHGSSQKEDRQMPGHTGEGQT
jgi:hypothetical protein